MGIPVLNEKYFERQQNEGINKISKERVFAAFRSQKFDLEFLLVPRRMTWKKTRVFNRTIRKIKNILCMNLYEILVYLEEDYLTFSYLLYLLDERSKAIIMKEMEIDFHINYCDTILSEILSYEELRV